MRKANERLKLAIPPLGLLLPSRLLEGRRRPKGEQEHEGVSSMSCCTRRTGLLSTTVLVVADLFVSAAEPEAALSFLVLRSLFAPPQKLRDAHSVIKAPPSIPASHDLV